MYSTKLYKEFFTKEKGLFYGGVLYSVVIFFNFLYGILSGIFPSSFESTNKDNLIYYRNYAIAIKSLDIYTKFKIDCFGKFIQY